MLSQGEHRLVERFGRQLRGGAQLLHQCIEIGVHGGQLLLEILRWRAASFTVEEKDMRILFWGR